MVSSDYVSGGGALKLKGGSIDKKKKKKRPKPSNDTSTADGSPNKVSERALPKLDSSRSPRHTPGRSLTPETAKNSLEEAGGGVRQKTEAEKRVAEARRKRFEEKLKREGVKTHKEKVEELNKYLSGLSEHHDMPKIGPG